MADLVDRGGKLVEQARIAWWIEGERPLSTIRDDLASLLRPLAEDGPAGLPGGLRKFTT